MITGGEYIETFSGQILASYKNSIKDNMAPIVRKNSIILELFDPDKPINLFEYVYHVNDDPILNTIPANARAYIKETSQCVYIRIYRKEVPFPMVKIFTINNESLDITKFRKLTLLIETGGTRIITIDELINNNEHGRS